MARSPRKKTVHNEFTHGAEAAFAALCRKRTPEQFMKELLLSGKAAKKTQGNDDSKSTFVKVCESLGATREQMAETFANAYGVPYAVFRAAEEDFTVMPVGVIMDFCEDFAVHPVDLVPEDGATSPQLLDLLIDVYKTFRPTLSKDESRRDETISVFIGESHPESSIEPLRCLRDSYRRYDDELSGVITEFLETMIVNDGNHNLGNFAGNAIEEITFARLQDKFVENEQALIAVKKSYAHNEDCLDELGFEYFGYSWEHSKRLLWDTDYELGEEVASLLLTRDLKPIKVTPEAVIEEIQGRLSIRKYLERDKNHFEYACQESREIARGFQKFCQDHRETINFYNNRQHILESGVLSGVRPMGDPIHDLYICMDMNDKMQHRAQLPFSMKALP